MRVILRQLLLRKPFPQELEAALLPCTRAEIPLAKGSRQLKARRSKPPELATRIAKQRHQHEPSLSRRQAAEKTGFPLRSHQTFASRPALRKRHKLPQ